MNSNDNIVRAKDDPRKVLFYFFLVIFIFCVVFYLHRESKVRQFTRHGVETKASIVRLFYEKDIRRRSIPKYCAEVMYMHKDSKESMESDDNKLKVSRTASGDFRFEMKQLKIDPGSLQTGNISLTQEEYHSLKRGDKVRVLYLSSNPGEAMLVTHLHRKGQQGILVTGLISLVLSGFMLYLYRKSLRTN